MSDWQIEVIRWALTVCGIAGGMMLVHSLVFFEFRREAEGYIQPALKRLRWFLLTVFIAEWLIGMFLFGALLFLTPLAWFNLPYPVMLLLAVMVGMLSASFPYALEGAFLGRSTSFLRLRRWLTRLMRWLNLAVREEFARAIAIYRERDVYDCQKDNWIPGVSAVEIGRRLRIIYERSKEAIAIERKDPGFLFYDEGRNPWEKYYLLVRFLGRDELIARLADPPPSPSADWDGRERRLRPVRGSKADRVKSDPDPDRQRCYDNPERLKRIRAGKSLSLPIKDAR
jgi:hypothetical protein